MGGLGLRAAEDHAPAAYAASVLSAQLQVQDLVGGRQVLEVKKVSLVLKYWEL